jgi:hypothetical protein
MYSWLKSALRPGCEGVLQNQDQDQDLFMQPAFCHYVCMRRLQPSLLTSPTLQLGQRGAAAGRRLRARGRPCLRRRRRRAQQLRLLRSR